MRTDRDTHTLGRWFGASAFDVAQAALSLSRRAVCRLTILLAAAAVTGCGVLSTEEQLLTRFFEASRLHDTTAVARLSAVTFNPRIDGVVGDFEIVDVAETGAAKRVTIRATVRQLEGATADTALVVTMLRKGDRWFISEIR